MLEIPKIEQNWLGFETCLKYSLNVFEILAEKREKFVNKSPQTHLCTIHNHK